jgi:hypothetical protein
MVRKRRANATLRGASYRASRCAPSRPATAPREPPVTLRLVQPARRRPDADPARSPARASSRHENASFRCVRIAGDTDVRPEDLFRRSPREPSNPWWPARVPHTLQIRGFIASSSGAC